MSILSGILLLAAVILWLGLIATAVTLNASDPAGNALSSAYGVFIALGLWALLALLMIIAGARGGLPGWTKLAALLLVPASCGATLVAMNVMSGHPGLRWPLVLPVLVPPLIMVFAAWAYLPSVRATMPAIYAGGVVWGSVLLLSLIPLPVLWIHQRADQRGREHAKTEAALEDAKQQDASQRENLANFAKLTAESPLGDYVPFTGDTNPLREQALEGARALGTRQSDAERMLIEDQGFPLVELQNLNLAPTPAFCEEARAFLIRNAEDWRTTVEVPPAWETRAKEFEQYLGSMGWLVANNCDIDDALAATETSVRSYPSGPGRELFLAALRRLRVSP